MRAEDAEPLSAYQSDPAYLAHYAAPPDAHAIVASAIKWALEEPRINFQFAVVLASSDTVVGCAGLRQRSYSKREAEIGVEIDPRYWRRGLAREVLSELISFGVSTLSVEMFWGCTARSNRPAQSLVEEFGFTRVDSTGDSIRMQLRVPE